MTLKEAKKEARKFAQQRNYAYLTISKQTEVGWYPSFEHTQRSVFFVHKDGTMDLLNSEFARNYQRQYLPNVRCKIQRW